MLLTDRSEALPLLSQNINTNREAIEAAGGSARVAALDWEALDGEGAEEAEGALPVEPAEVGLVLARG